jgi:hypothetical protein
MLRHLGGIGLFILAALDSSVLPTLGGVDALTIVLLSLHPVQFGWLGLRSFSRVLSRTACRVLEFSIDVLRERYSTESRHSPIDLEAFLCRSPHSFRHHI